jgi:hypothetical protein
MSTIASINGVDTTTITALRSQLDEPGKGDTLWKSEIIWQGGFRNQIRIRDFPTSYADEPGVARWNQYRPQSRGATARSAR